MPILHYFIIYIILFYYKLIPQHKYIQIAHGETSSQNVTEKQIRHNVISSCIINNYKCPTGRRGFLYQPGPSLKVSLDTETDVKLSFATVCALTLSEFSKVDLGFSSLLHIYFKGNLFRPPHLFEIVYNAHIGQSL